MRIVPGKPQIQDSQQLVPVSREALAARYTSVRRMSEALSRPLEMDDFNLQAMPEVSPAKWHLAHTTWFFETFLLKEFQPGYKPVHAQYEYLFNSYYEQVGNPFPRAQRGLLSRPTVDEIFHYRAQIDEAMTSFLANADDEQWPEIAARTRLGCHHEEQHQELFLTDIKYNLAINPLKPAYRDDLPGADADTNVSLAWSEHPGGINQIGHQATGFAFDNEGPRHRVLLAPFALATRLVTNGELLEFMQAGGYERPEYWLADGWRAASERQWRAPLYWEKHGAQWKLYTLAGLRPLNMHEPVCHVSFYEADAYARWAGKRLPSEAEWEVVAQQQDVRGNLREAGHLHPMPAAPGSAMLQLFGDTWEWTSSAYAPYSGFRPARGALGEYNGKFMINQLVLRGGSCITPTGHIRATYRNFFYPVDRWQFSGIRLADDR